MNKTFWNRFLDSCSDNRKSKIENPKWVSIFAIALTFAFGGVVAQAQQPKKVARIGYLGNTVSGGELFPPFRERLRELGYIEGQNITIEPRYWEGKRGAPAGACRRANPSQLRRYLYHRE